MLLPGPLQPEPQGNTNDLNRMDRIELAVFSRSVLRSSDREQTGSSFVSRKGARISVVRTPSALASQIVVRRLLVVKPWWTASISVVLYSPLVPVARMPGMTGPENKGYTAKGYHLAITSTPTQE